MLYLLLYSAADRCASRRSLGEPTRPSIAAWCLSYDVKCHQRPRTGSGIRVPLAPLLGAGGERGLAVSDATLRDRRPEFRRSTAILGGLAAVFVLSRVVLEVVPTDLALEQQRGYLAWPVVLGLLVAGYVGWWLSRRIGMPDLWAGSKPLRTRILGPAALGVAAGIMWVITDLFVRREAHASFPGVFPLYTYAAVFSEVATRLFGATFLGWLVAVVLLRGRGVAVTFWVVSIISTLLTAYAQAAATYRISDREGALFRFDVISAFALAAVFEPVAFYLYYKRNILAPLAMHFAFFAVWHMLWGGLFPQGPDQEPVRRAETPRRSHPQRSSQPGPLSWSPRFRFWSGRLVFVRPQTG